MEYKARLAEHWPAAVGARTDLGMHPLLEARRYRVRSSRDLRGKRLGALRALKNRAVNTTVEAAFAIAIEHLRGWELHIRRTRSHSIKVSSKSFGTVLLQVNRLSPNREGNEVRGSSDS